MLGARVGRPAARWLGQAGSSSSSSSSSRRMASALPDVKRTCLYDFHLERGARMETFAGHAMPIVYKDQTISVEHMQCRERAAAFDVSHMMQTLVRGKHRAQFIELLTVADVHQMPLNKCTLTVLTNDAGGILDDLIVAKRPDRLHVVSNAGNAELVWAWLTEHRARLAAELPDVQLERCEGRALIALQGPEAARVLAGLASGLDKPLSELGFMATTEAAIRAAGVSECTLTRCGYTGEDGFEISLEPSGARALMELLCAQPLVRPAGLGARDTLRLEAGLCLHGHDITHQTTPVEAGLGWLVHKRRRLEGGFPGHAPIVRQLREGPKVRRLGLVARGSGPPAREGSRVLGAAPRAGDAVAATTQLGHVTSGTFAPKLAKNIAMAYLPSELAGAVKERRALVCEVRGRHYEYELAPMPFVKSNYYTKG